MSVTEDTVRRIAKLARIRIAEEGVGALAKDLSRILAWVSELDELDTKGVEPMTGIGGRLKRRTDVITDGGSAEEILANAPHAEDGFFTVPKVVE